MQEGFYALYRTITPLSARASLNAFLPEFWKLFRYDLPVQSECVPFRILEIIRLRSTSTV